ncbi:azurin [Ravibacter arvi]|uniref:Azurin n=1 Tax=Ravibacter arvi TaxID=2051041 RepID=A0ABP8LX74_9BACT
MTKFRLFFAATILAFVGLISTAQAQKQVELTLEGTDAMQFTKKELKVKAGQSVKLTLKHTGKLAKAAMGHNFVLLAQGTDVASFGQKAAQARDTEYIPKSEASKILAHTKLIGGGESTTVEFKAPKKGTYTYICSFPGHYALMQGKLIVE